ncbi:MAG: hypothetical protein KGY76_00885 [Candidatus Thermoplasmatota archaeon]|nr:hypothetical protein [Candidatus Thermoplasmatota archaeon]
MGRNKRIITIIIILSLLINSVGIISEFNISEKSKGERDTSASEIGSAFGTDIARNGDNLYVPQVVDEEGLLLSMSDDNGKTWNTKKLVGWDNLSSSPDIAIDDEYIHLVFSTDYEEGPKHISDLFYMRSKDEGETWSKPYKVTKNDDQFRYSGSSIVTEDNMLYVMGYRFGNSTDPWIFSIRSPDDGENWSDFSYPAKDLDIVDWPPVSFSVIDSKIFLAYYSRSMTYFKKSEDEGNTWSSKKALNSQPEYAGLSQITAEDGILFYVYAAWPRDFDSVSYKIKKSYNEGEDWEFSDTILQYEIPDTDFEGIRFYDFEIENKTLTLSYSKYLGSNRYKILCEVSYDGGETWNESIEISEGSLLLLAPSTTFSEDGKDIHVIWNDYGDKKVLYRQVTPGKQEDDNKKRAVGIVGMILLVLVSVFLFYIVSRRK